MPITSNMNNRDTSGQNSRPASQTAQTAESTSTAPYNQAPAGLRIAISPPAASSAAPARR